MGDHTTVRKLVEMLSVFFTEGKTFKEDPTSSITREFFQNIQDVLFCKQMIMFVKWEPPFNICYKRMIISPEIFLRYVFYACLTDAKTNYHVFGRFLCTLALLLRMSVGLRSRTKIDFCKLVPDIFMVFYEEELQKPFARCKGFQGFVEFVNKPKYLETKCIVRNITYNYYLMTSINDVPESSRKKVLNMLHETPSLPKDFNFVEAEIDADCLRLAKKVLDISKPEFIPALDDPNAGLSDLMKLKAAQLENSKKIFEKIEQIKNLGLASGSRLNSETNDDALKQNINDAWCQNIIEAVIKHNHSKSLCNRNANNIIQEKANRILEPLKSTIISFLEVLDEYGKE